MPDFPNPFTAAIHFVLPHEEEFVRGHWGDDSREEFVRTENVAGDPGGRTRYGIDAASHPGVDIASLTRAEAVEIYYQEWEQHNLDLLPGKLAIAAFDVWVNGGHANVWLQHAYNVTRTPGAAPLAEDGILGAESIQALAHADQDNLVALFLKQRDARFEALAQKPSLAQFLKGWEQRDTDLREFLRA